MPYRVKPTRSPLRFTHLVQALLLLVGIVSLTTWLTEREYNHAQESLRSDVLQEALTFKVRLETELNSNIFLANGLAATIVSYPDLPSAAIDAALAELYRLGRDIRTIALAPNNRVTHIHPLQGNEASVGAYYPDLPARWPGIAAAISRRETLLAGPLGPVGDQTLVSRTPVYLQDESYWGLLSVVQDFQGLLRSAALSTDNPKFQFALRDLSDNSLAPFWGTASILDQDPVRVAIQAPGQTWELLAVPRDGWNTAQADYQLLRVVGILGALLAVLIFLGFTHNRLNVIATLSRLQTILNTTHEGIVVLDNQGTVLEFNPAAERLFGYRASEVLGRSMTLLLRPDERALYTPYPRRTVQPERGGNDVTGIHKDGHEISLEMTVGHTVIGTNSYYVGVIRDVSERKAVEAVLKRQAEADALTGALNRRAFQAIADKLFATARRHHRPLSLLTIDADRFKVINDTYGHDGGDRVLVRLVETLKELLRSGDTLCRFGGEEFLVLLPETDATQAMQSAERIRSAIAALEVECNQHRIRFTVSIGVATLTPDMQHISQLITAADIALYDAKGGGRNRAVLYTPSPIVATEDELAATAQVINISR
jgi:diguanylate cyclase (GGDEF)-like protein/PAS domain S-box-containing protein